MAKKKETGSERYKKTIRQRRIFVLSIFVIVVVLCICLFTPLFGITEVTVNGNSVVSSEDIIAASGINQGENVFRISTSKAEKSILSIAYVEQAEIKRKFPARVEIEIQEAKPDVIVDTPTQFIVTTVKGRVLEMTDDVTHLTSPIIYGVEVTGAEVAKPVQTADEELFAMNMEYIRCFYETEHWQNIDEFHVSDITNFVVVMKSGMKVTFGSIDSAEGLQRKIKMMTKIFEQVEQNERSYLDLTTDKGYYGEYTWAEMEEMRKREEGILEEEEEPEEIEGETDSEGEETSDEENTESSDEKKESQKSEKPKASEKPEKSEKSQKPAENDDEEKTEKSEKSEKPKASAKPSKEADPRKKDTSGTEEGESSDGEAEESDTTEENGAESTTEDSASQENAE